MKYFCAKCHQRSVLLVVRGMITLFSFPKNPALRELFMFLFMLFIMSQLADGDKWYSCIFFKIYKSDKTKDSSEMWRMQYYSIGTQD